MEHRRPTAEDTPKFEFHQVSQDEDEKFYVEKYKEFQEDENIRYGFYECNDGEQRLNYVDSDKYVKIIKIIEDKNGEKNIIFELRFKKNDMKSGTKTYIKCANNFSWSEDYGETISWDNYHRPVPLKIENLRTWICCADYIYIKK